MMKTKLLLPALLVLSLYGKAQNITPKDLFQVYKMWQMDDPNYYKYTYQYLMTVDKRWTVPIPPNETNGLTLVFGFKLNETDWYKKQEWELTMVNDKTSPVPKFILFSFTDKALYDLYTQQMNLMDAKRIADGDVSGGHQYIYKVSDIVIFLREFPPGINGDDRIYQVQLGHAPN